MAKVSNVVKVIAGVAIAVGIAVAAIVTGVAPIIASIASTIATSVWSYVSSIGTAVAGFAVSIYSGFSAFLSTAVWTVSMLVKGELTLATAWTIISASWTIEVSSALSTVWNVVNTILKPVQSVINSFRSFYNTVRNGIFGQIVKEVRDYANTLGFIFDTGKVISYFKQEKYSQALFYMMVSFDSRLNEQNSETMKKIDNQMHGFLSDLNDIFRYFREDITWLSSLTAKFETIFSDIARAFGAKEIGEIAKTVDRFRREVIGETLEDLKRFENRIKGLVTEVFHPITRMLQDWNWAMRDWKERQRLFTVDYIKRKPEKEFLISEIKSFFGISLTPRFDDYVVAVQSMRTLLP